MLVKACLGAGVVTVGLLAWWGGLIGPPGHAKSADVAAVGPPVTPDATGLAEEMLSRISGAEFVGTIDFQYEFEVLRNDHPETVEQFHKLYVGPTGELRLDVWSGTETDPIICCVKPGQAWMVWADSPLVRTSPYPIKLRGAPQGWLGQLYFQSGQTVAEARLLLTNGLGGAVGRPVTRAELEHDRLRVEFRAVPAGDGLAQARVEALRLPDGTYYPTEVAYGSAWVLSLTDIRADADGIARAHRLDQVSDTGRATRTAWTLVNVAPVHARDENFAACFEAPQRLEESYPHLVGAEAYDADGRDMTTVFSP